MPMAQGKGGDARLHVVALTFGTLGDLFPFLAVAQALQARGHRVSVMAHVVHAPQVAAAGLRVLPVGSLDEHRVLTANPDLWDARKGFALVWQGLMGMMDAVEAHLDRLAADEGPCVLLAHPLALPACDLARAAHPRLRVVAAYLAPSNLRTCHDPLTVGPMRIPRWMPMAWRRRLWATVDRRVVDPAALPSLNGRRAARGLAPVAHFIGHMHSVADAALTFFPPAFAATQPDWPQPLHRGGFPVLGSVAAQPVPDALARFLNSGTPPVVFTPGTGHRHAAAYFRATVHAARALGLRAVLLTPYREQLPDTLPEGVLWQEFVPLPAVLPRVRALVHHGGIGTVAAALCAGVPQLVVPFAHDQFDNAARVERLGAGGVLPAARLSQRRLARALRRLLANEAAHRRAALALDGLREADAPGTLQAMCDAIEAAANAGVRAP